ncbi:glutamate-cysteine ligase, partial [Nannochloropsis gaditana]
MTQTASCRPPLWSTGLFLVCTRCSRDQNVPVPKRRPAGTTSSRPRRASVLSLLPLLFLLLLLTTGRTQAGLLKVGRPLFWPSSLPHLRPVRRAGVRQFLNIYHRLKDIQQDDLLWGEEVEYGILKVDRSKRRVWLSLRGKEVMESLIKKEKDYTQRW